jgi:hypothetical protein
MEAGKWLKCVQESRWKDVGAEVRKIIGRN